MTRDITPAGWPATRAVDDAFAEVRESFDRFCLAAGIEALGTMMEADVTAACGPRHGREAARRAHRWGRTRGRIGFHGGKIEVDRPRIRSVDGGEVTIPSREAAAEEHWLDRWAINLMLINVSTRRFGRAVRLPEGDVPAPPGSGISKSAASRRFVALSAARLADFMAADLAAARPSGGPNRRAASRRRSRAGRRDRGRRRRQQACAGAGGRGDREFRDGSGPAGQPGLARARPDGAKTVHRRRRESVVEGDPPHHRFGRCDPALPDPQGAQHHGTPAERASCGHPSGAAPGLRA